MEVAILGAGCSGSSLAYFLAERGFSGEVHVFDERSDFSREQRWCSWGPLPGGFCSLVDASWTGWKVVHGAQQSLQYLPERPYLHVYAPRFFSEVHERLRGFPNVHLHLGCAVRSVAAPGLKRPVEVETDSGTVGVDLAFDSRPGKSEPEGYGISLKQSFVGRRVVAEEPVFDPSVVTLMDFGQTPELSFVYVLAFSAHEALIESTSFAQETIGHGRHLRRVEDYAANLGATLSGPEESGCIPMTTRFKPPKLGPNLYALGVAGGAARPSSGYAFVEILRQTERVAEAIVFGRDPTPPPIARKYGVLDSVFLEVINSSPELARQSFVRMFERVPPASLVRFLSGESDLVEDARLVAALEKMPFLRAAIRRAAARIGAQR